MGRQIRTISLIKGAAIVAAMLGARGAYAQTPEVQPDGAASAGAGALQAVETEALSKDAFSTGLLTTSEGALSAALWGGADAANISFLLGQAPARPLTPSIGQALRRVLLSAGAGPANAGPELGGRKLLALARAGFVEEARTVASLSSAPSSDPATGQAHAIADLLAANENAACTRNLRLTSGRDQPFWVKLRVLCYALAEEQAAAELTYKILRDQALLSDTEDALLLAISIGVMPSERVLPQTALDYAIMRRLELPLSADQLGKADGGVLVTLARDESVAPALRIAAAQFAAQRGIFDGAAAPSAHGKFQL